MSSVSRISPISISLWAFTACAPAVPSLPPTAEVPVASASAPLPSAVSSSLPACYSTPVALMPQAVTSFGAAATATHLYTLGGYFGIAHQYSREGQRDAFERMNRTTGEWETLPSTGPIQSATLSAFDGKLYQVGGLRIHNATGEPAQLESLATVQRFDPARGSWETLTPLPVPRSSHDAVVSDGQLFVIGGWKLSGDASSGEWDDAIYVADLKTEPLQWQRVEAPLRLRALGSAVVDEKLVVIGGIGDGEVSSAVHLYDLKSQRWSRGPDYPEAGFGVRATTVRGAVVASGLSGSIYALNLAENRWAQLGSLAFPRVFHQLVTVGDEAFALGGIAGMRGVDRIRHVERVSFGQGQQAVVRWELDAPGPAKNRQGAFLNRDQLYVFGGNNSLGQHDFGADNFLAEGHRLDLGSLQWKPAPPFPTPQQSMQTLISREGVGFAIGGFGLDGTDLKTQPELYLFDFDEQSWSQSDKGLPQSRTQFSLVEHGEALWVFGGLEFDDTRSGQDKFVHPLAVLTLDQRQPSQGFVPAGFDIPRPRRAFAGALAGDQFYMVGGMAAGFKPVAECDAYDFESRAWTQFSCPSRSRIGAEMVALSGKLYLAAGRSPGADGKLTEDKSVEVFDTATGRWSMWTEALPMPDTHQMRMFGFGDRLLIYSAQRSDAKVELLLVDPAQKP